MMKNKVLVCFTASFPYGLKETFFENELPYLSKAFDEVIIFPKYNPTRSSKKRIVPSNVVCFEPLVPPSKAKRILLGILNGSPFGFYLKDFFRERVFLSRAKFSTWLTSLISYRISYQVMKRYLRNTPSPAATVMYSYWAESPLFISALFRPYKKVLRMHRSDFYVEEKKGGYLALRPEIYDATDLLAPISQHIVDLLRSDYGIENKIHLSRLGVSNETANADFESIPVPCENIIRIVSCSRVDPVKRVSLIADALEKYSGGTQIEWHHFGDGILFEDIKARTNQLNEKSNVRVILHSWKTQGEIFAFYKTHAVTWLVNVSESEGIPVSIMEAVSFGIPVIATDVGGSSEIVKHGVNGYLLKKEFQTATLLNHILDCHSTQYMKKRQEAHRTWLEDYQAEKNYLKFAEMLRDWKT